MSVAGAFGRLSGALTGFVRKDEPLARHTSFRIGGPAALWCQCDTIADLSLVTDVLAEEEVAWTALGSGTNVLASDDGYDAAVIVLGKDFKRHTLDGVHLRTGAGVSLSAVVQDAFSSGMTGLEFAVGIPGTVGGAVAMNAGSREVWIGSIVESVTLFIPGNGLERVRCSEVRWGYRRTDLAARGIVVEASLRLEEGDPAIIRNAMEAALRRRKRSQPLGVPNAGSVFVNPENDSAGRLIETCGMKGARVGGAAVSDVHANFIVNAGGATASDVLELVHRIREAVRSQHGIELTPEIRFLGSFES